MGGAPYIRLKQGGGPTFKVSILYTIKRASGAKSAKSAKSA